MPPVAESVPDILSAKDLALSAQQSKVSSTPKRRTKKKHTPKRLSGTVQLDGNVYLKNRWSMYFDDCSSDEDKTRVGSFNTVQNFWRYYNQIVDPSKFPNRSNLSIYKEASTPNSNDLQKACKWTIPCSKQDTGKVWMKIVVALLGEQFSRSSHISGVTLSVFHVMDNVILWGNSKSTPKSIERTANQLRKLIENDTPHTVSFTKGPFTSLSSSSGYVNNGSTSAFAHSKKLMSTNDLSAEEAAAKAKHKKSSSFSSSQFVELRNVKGHRKSKSVSKKGESLSFSGELSSSSSSNNVVTKRASLLNQLYQNGPSEQPFQIAKRESVSAPSVSPSAPVASANRLNLRRMIALFVLVSLVLSGLLFTPK